MNTTSIKSVIANLLTGLESGLFSIALSIAVLWMPQLAALAEKDLRVIGDNFRKFLTDLENGADWGKALADMMTADWNETTSDAKEAAIDFAEDVAVAMQHAGLIPAKQDNSGL